VIPLGDMKLLAESSSSTLTKNGKRWRAVLAVPGQGSSGFYSENVLKEFGPVALAPGAKAFIDHDFMRSPKDMIGVYPDGAWWDDESGSLVGELEVFPHWQDFVEAVGPHAGLSIYMMGETDSDGNVVALHPDRMNGVDLVSYPGLAGSGLVEKLYESAHRAGLATTDPATDVQDTNIMEGIEMEKEELLAILEGFKEEITASVIESVKPVEDEIPAEDEVTDVADMAAVAEAAIDAGIPAELRAEIYESAKTMTGAAALALVEARKGTVDAIRKAVTESVKVEASAPAGRVVEAGSSRFDLTQIAKVK
jgi:hypothetical protein